MGNSPISGVLGQGFIKSEGANYDTFVAHAATDAFDFITFELEPTLNFEEINSHRGTGSLQNEIQQDEGGSWSAQVYASTNALGVAPDYGEFLKAGFGTETISGGVSVTYSLTDASVQGTSLHSLQGMRVDGDALQRIGGGMAVEQIVAEITGNTTCKFSFSGGFARYGFLYDGATVNGAHAGGLTTITLGSGLAVLLKNPALIKFATEDNGGAGYTVTAVDTVADTITITPGLANPLVGGEALAAVFPSQTLGGTILAGTKNALTIDSASIGLISHKVTLNTGIKMLDGEASTERANRIFRAEMRKVEAEIEAYYLAESAKFLGGAHVGTIRDIAARMGANTAAARIKIQTPAVRVAVTPISLADAEVATIGLNGPARQNAAAADELVVLFD